MKIVRSFPAQMDFHSLPNEMWIYVFESMIRPSDLLKIIQTCRQFYALAIRVLYRKVQWLGPFDFIRNACFWDSQTSSMTDVPTSLTVGISHVHPASFGRFDPGSAIVEADGTWVIPSPATLGLTLGFQPPVSHPPTNLRELSFFASTPLYHAICDRVSTFSMLEELVLHYSLLPYIVYSAIKSLAHLRHLSIQYCTLPPSQSDTELQVCLSNLPITELTLWCLKGDADTSPDSNYIHALHLCTAQNLHTLRVDWNSISARFFGQKFKFIQYDLPAELEVLELRMPAAKLWPSEADTSRSVLIQPLSTFLARCPTIRRLSIVNRLPSLPLDKAALPLLDFYSGPLSTVLSVFRRKSVVNLEITDDDKKLQEITNLLPELAKMKPDLRSLYMTFRRWDNEILYPVSDLFPQLRKFRVKYDEGFLTEYTILSMGAQFLYRMPHLETLQFYKRGSLLSIVDPFLIHQGTRVVFQPSTLPQRNTDTGPGETDTDAEVKELIMPWRKHCRDLREIQFVAGYAWRRAFDGDEWCKRPVEPVRILVG